jgi:hypothetical protein
MAAVGTGTRRRRRRCTPRCWRTCGELVLQVGDAVAHDAAVLLELGLALAAEGAPAALAGKVGPGAGQAGQRILHAGQRHLQHGLAGVRPVGENLEDHLLAVDDGEAGHSSSQLRCWAGESSSSNTMTSAPAALACAMSSSVLPLPSSALTGWHLLRLHADQKGAIDMVGAGGFEEVGHRVGR